MIFFILFLMLFSQTAWAHHESLTPVTQRTAAGENSISSEALINSPVATTMGRSALSFGFTFDYHRYNSIPADDAHRLHHQDRDVHGKNHEEFYHLNAGYGVLEDVDLYLTAPIVAKNSIDIHSHRSLGQKEYASGFGDMRLLGKYRFWKKGAEAALLAGIKFPTGRTDERQASSEKFEAEQQAGTGSWDGEFGLAVSRSFKNRISVASSFQYFLKTEGGQGHEAGDVFRTSVGISRSLRDFGKYPNVSAVLELNNEWALKDRSRTQRRVFDSGGTSIFLAPGINASFNPHVSLFAAIPVPIYQNLGGEHEELRLEVLAGIALSV